MAALWIGLNGTDAASWLVGLPVVALAAWVSLRLGAGTGWRWSLRAGLAFAGFFARESLLGGLDVARRALHPGLPLRPGVLIHVSRLPAGTPRQLLCGVVSLLPGTLVMEVQDATLRIHALEAGPRVAEELRALERRVAALFGLAPGEPRGEAE
jgi:multicomponent Na+:H+ antiporter subunit E